jgi:hypothetical protein
MSEIAVKEVNQMPRMVRKTIELDQDYIDRARLIFEVRTEKEAVNKAMLLLKFSSAASMSIAYCLLLARRASKRLRIP